MAEPREIPVLTISRAADGAIVAGAIVEVGTVAGSVKEANAATDTLIGVAHKAAADLERLDVRVLGVAKVLGGGTVTEGDKVTTDGDGKGVTASSDADHIIGVALEAGALDTLFEVLLCGPAAQRAS